MRQPRISVEIESPTGVVLDVSARLERGAVTSMSEEIAEDILELTHSDFDLRLDDFDGAIEAFFADVDPDDIYLLRVARETLKRRPKWERLFEGILQLPWSLRFERKDKEVSLQALSYSKLLELYSSDDIKRSADGVTVTVAAASQSATVSAGTAFRIGDDITVSYGGLTEDKVVEGILGTNLRTTEVFTNAFTDARIEINTPFPRHNTVKALVESLFDVAGIADVDIVLEGSPNDDARPFYQGWTNKGLWNPYTYLHLISKRATLSPNAPTPMLSMVQFGDQEWGSHDPDDEWEVEDTPSAQADWTPYLDAEPSALEVLTNDPDEDIQQAGNPPQDATTDWNCGYDHTAGETWAIRKDLLTGNHRLRIYKDGVSESVTVESIANTFAYGSACMDFVPTADWGLSQDVTVYSYQETDNDARAIKTYDGTTLRTVSTAVGGGGCRTVAEFECVAIQDYGDDLTASAPQSGTIRFYEGSDSGALLSVLKATTYYEPPMLMWTMRGIGDFLACMYQQDSTTRCRVWRWSDLEAVDDFQVSAETSTQTYMTKHQVEDEGGVLRECLVGTVNGVDMFMLCETMLGTIPYADFEGDDIAEALKKLAALSNATFEVDRFKRGIFRQRGKAVPTGRTIADVGIPRSQESTPVWEFYKDSVQVTGEADDGSEVSIIVGETGKSARRLEVSSDLIKTVSYARAIAYLYLDFFSVKRTQENVRIEDGDILRTFDQVTLDQKDYIVLEPQTDVVERSQDLTLVSVA